MTPLIEAGAPIAVVAPCGVYNRDRYRAGLRIARENGLNVQPLDDLLRPWRYLAGNDAHRLEQLVHAMTSDDYAAVWIARGGYGLTRLLDDLPWSRFDDRPVLGFSDVTALFAGMRAHGVGTAVHAPVVHSIPKSDEPSLDALVAVLQGKRPALDGTIWIEGHAEGPVVGGNLCLLASTCGTPEQLDARGCILVLEEIGEPAYRVDRMLQQLHSAGVFDSVTGIVLGEFVDCRVPEGADFTIEDVLKDQLTRLGVPILAEAPIGHGAQNHAFVWGRHGVFDPALPGSADGRLRFQPAPTSRA